MRQILDHTTHTVTVHDEEHGDQEREVVHSVNFIDHLGALHGLVFHKPGTDVSGDLEDHPRIVGVDTPHYAFDTPEAAVDAYENGRIV